MSAAKSTEQVKESTLQVNVAQKEFYNQSSDERKWNFIMQGWRIGRRNMYYLLQEARIWGDIFALQKEWIGDLSNQRVLDFGCYEGNALSEYLASNSSEYVGVDLSDKALSRLDSKLRKKGITNHRLYAQDILADSFTETGFDLVYAQGVLHHFSDISVLLSVLKEKLNPGGKIVSVDPLQTSLLTKLVRGTYHPFRSDKDWEWPFTKRTMREIERHFTVRHVQGFVGKSKFAIPLAAFNKQRAARLARSWHQQDLQEANEVGPALWNCLQLAMCLENTSSAAEPRAGT